MRRHEYFYDSTGNLLLVLEIVYYVVVVCYYVYQWFKNRRVRVRAYRQERRERRRLLLDARTFAVAICAALGLGSAAQAEVFWESVDAVHASAVPRERAVNRPTAAHREGAKSAFWRRW